MSIYRCTILIGLAIICLSCKSDPATINVVETTNLATLQSPQTEKQIETAPTFIHTVYFWLNDPKSDLSKQFMTEGVRTLSTVKSIKHMYWGPPADTDRAVIDNSYDVACVVTFASPEDQDAYQADPIHLQFIEDYAAAWKEVKVYDNIVTGSK